MDSGAVVPEVPQPQMITVPMSQIQRQEIEWLWQDRMAMGMVSLLAGFPGSGKSFLALDMAARISRGLPWPDQPDTAQAIGRTLLLSFEDDPSRAIRPRLEACGADLSRVHIFEGIRVGDRQDKSFDVRLHLPLMERFLSEYGDIRMIVIDPLTSAMGDGDQNSNAEMRRAMTLLSDFARRTGAAIVGITHFSKRQDTSALYKLLGSVAFSAVARSVWIVLQDPPSEDDPNPPRKLLYEKNSNSALRTGLSFEIANGGVRWLEGIVFPSATEALADSGQSLTGKRQQAEQFLLDALESGAEQSADDLEKQATEKGIAVTTLRRAKAQLQVRGIISKRKSPSGTWLWRKGTGAEKDLLCEST
jgi:putative DNA primase/helicase